MGSLSPTSRILELAHLITTNTQTVASYLHAHNLPDLSFTNTSAPADPPTAASPSAERARQAALAAATELRDLLAGPATALLPDWTGAACLRAVSRLNLAALVPLRPADGVGTPFAAVAAHAALPEALVARVLRHAATRRVFREPAPGLVAHTAASALLARDALVRDVVGAVVDEMWPAGVRVAEALERFPGTGEPGECGYALANEGEGGRLRSMFEVFEADGERARRFGACMKAESALMPFPLEEFGWEGVVVDVGGGVGFSAVELARRFKGTRFVVEDLSKTVEQGRLILPGEVKERVEFIEHDFFSPQPVKDADIYFFRRIFHDWSNKYAIEIIRNLIPALKPGARIRVNELLVPKPGELPLEHEKIVRNVDFAMMAVCSGQERSIEEWQELFRTADKRFKFKFCKTTPPGLMALIEFIWDP